MKKRQVLNPNSPSLKVKPQNSKVKGWNSFFFFFYLLPYAPFSLKSPLDFCCTFYLLSSILISSCTKDKIPLSSKGYPEEIGKIMLNSCATPGCHNEKSYEAAAGLNLSSWEKLFEGYNNNAAVIPYSAEQSPLLYFVNTYSDLGIQLEPTMPLSASPLSREEVVLIRDWISDGAPDKNGFVKFSDNANRKKFYVANQGCDLVTVFDAGTKLAMRYVKVGISVSAESPHMLKVSPDGKYWYVCFLASTVLQKFRTSDDSFVGNIAIGGGYWNTFSITPDSKKAVVVDWAASGKAVIVDLENMQLLKSIEGSGLLINPHGSAINSNGDTLYITAQSGNFIYKVPVNDPTNYEEIILQPGETPSTTSKYDAHEIIFSPDSSEYFITCQKSNDVRVFRRSNDSWVATIAVGAFPQELSVSKISGYLFVSSPEDTVSFPGKRGSVSVIDYKNYLFIKKIFTGFQPHGIAVDDEKKLVYVANRNANSEGIAPHHTSVCGGRNGYVTIIDMNSLELIEDYNAEVSTDPYSVAVKNF